MKVDKFIFLIEFVVLDIKEDHEIAIILERPFLAIGKALVDVYNKKLLYKSMKKFNIYNTLKFLDEVCSCSQIDLILDRVKDMLYNMKPNDSLEHCNVNSLSRNEVLNSLNIDNILDDVCKELMDNVYALEALPTDNIDYDNFMSLH